jgi:hypothetical protein
MRQPLRAIVRWTALEVLVVQTLGAWLGRQVLWPVTWPASWAVYTLAGREGSRQGRFRHAPLAGGAVAVVADIVSAVRIALKDIDPAFGGGPDSPIQVVVMTLAAGLWGASWGLFGGLIGRLRQRRALLAFVIGVGPVLLAVGQLKSVSSNAFTRFVLGPATLIAGLVRPHNMGTTNNPVYEGTPLDLAAMTAGVVLCTVLYSAIAYALLACIARWRAHPGDLNRVGA